MKNKVKEPVKIKKYQLDAIAKINEEIKSCDDSFIEFSRKASVYQAFKNDWEKLQELYCKALEIEPRLKFQKHYTAQQSLFYIDYGKTDILPDDKLDISYDSYHYLLSVRRYKIIEVEGKAVKVYKDIYYRHLASNKNDFDYTTRVSNYKITIDSKLFDQLSKTAYSQDVFTHVVKSITKISDTDSSTKVQFINVPDRIKKLLAFS